ncbi:MAG: hypothetical protein EPN79_11025 [Burkholderiaceae bacterium]|nr:MAG: hypothetical protein EPN79_11025 [Burkholderiaceae bacterium]TBR76784.1 MAG: hypothetical protein EPN64_06050 [Burkholderiaceae bacterium]
MSTEQAVAEPGLVDSQQIPPNPEAGAARLDPGAKRVIKMVGLAFAVALVLVVILVLVASGKKSAATKVSLVTPPTGNQTEVTQTPYEKGRLAEFERQKAEASNAVGGVYVPPPSGGPLSGDKNRVNTGAATGNYGNYASAQAPVRQPTADETARQQAIQEGLNRQLQQLVTGETLGAPIVKVAVQDLSVKAPPVQSVAQAQSRSGNAGTQEDPDLPAPLTIEVARLTSPIDTSKSSYVSATLVGGRFAGAFLKGTAVLNHGEGLQVTFTDMRFHNKTAKINAVALDEKTSADALAGNIDRHILTRYVLPIAFATVSGAANAIAQRSAQIVSSGLSTEVAVPTATDQQAAAAGLASATQVGQQVVQGLQQQPNTAELPADTVIGVLFNTVQPETTGTAPQALTATEQARRISAEVPQQAPMLAQQQPVMQTTSLNTMPMGIPNYGSFAPAPSTISQVQVR